MDNAHKAHLARIFPSWVLENNESQLYAIFRTSFGGRVHVSIKDKGKYHFSGCWPEDKEGRQHCPSSSDDRPAINVSMDKSDESIRKDVDRRFLALYEPLYKEMVDEAAQTDAHTLARRTALKELAVLCAGRYDEQRFPDQIHTYNYGIHDVRVGHDGKTAEITIRYIPTSAMKEIIKLLKTLVPEKP